jgi:hypothetical protein
MDEKPKEENQEKNWIIFAAIVIIAIAAICILIAGSLYYLNWRGKNLPFTAELQTLMAENPTPEASLAASPGVETPAPPQFALPTLPLFEFPTRQPTEPVSPTLEPAATLPNLTGNQYLDEFTMIDDFSSNAFGWPVRDENLSIIQFEDEAYSIQIKHDEFFYDQGHLDYALIPVPFTPSYIQFDVWALAGEQDGTFGVFCQYRDNFNYYYIDFNLESREVLFAKIEGDQFIPLTELDSNGDYWTPVDALKPSPDEANRIAIECRLNVINLFVNDEFVQMVPIRSPINSPGDMAFFVYVFEFAETEGYKVFFDNVLIR